MSPDRQRTPTAESTAAGVPGGRTLTAFDSERFRLALAQSGIWTQGALAKRLRVSLQRIQQVAQGAIPPAELRARIARALQVRVSDLWVTCVPVDEVG